MTNHANKAQGGKKTEPNILKRDTEEGNQNGRGRV